MANNKPLGQNGQQLISQLIVASNAVKEKKSSNGQFVNVPGVGREVSFAYERLRNAAEYTQEHLVTQKAIRRFFVRNLSFINNSLKSRHLAEELMVELIQSGYVENNSQPVEMIDTLGSMIQSHYSNYWRLKEIGTKSSLAESWTLDLMSVSVEKMIMPNYVRSAFAQFAYRHYHAILPKDAFVIKKRDEPNYDASIYIAIYKALFKADIAGVRYDMQQLYSISDTNIHDYANFHKRIDENFNSELTENLTQYINKYGAPLRVLKNMAQSGDGFVELLKHSGKFQSAYAVQIEKEYIEARTKLNSGLIKSIAFLFITKTLIGVAIEVPYDMMTVGTIIYVPLIINLFAPIVYMALLRLGLKMPGDTNTRAMQQYAENMLYGDESQVNLFPSPKKSIYPIGFRIAYGLMFLLVFGLVTDILITLGFNWVQGIIFYIFFATANFLGFRLSRIVREMELVTNKAGFLTTLRDFIYMPFILLGQWISDKYSKVNIVAMILDLAIELPLKTILRLIRQWTEFINEKKDEI
ncbi:hypothetical protein HGB24_02455 [Candidatus Saccharibacteria bacterium]|nr:hypothetical protein [Candidatus Saccharibacteria bacterium]